jgi:type I restriction enzyme S subunit
MSDDVTLDEFSEGAGGKENVADEHPRFESLPDDWEISEIASIAEVVGGSTPSTSNEEYWGGGIPWATPTDITALSGNTISETEDTITKKGLDSASTHLLPPNSVLMTSRATIGECAINIVEMATNQGFKNLVPSDGIEPWYLYYRMLDTAGFLNSLGSGSTFDEVSKTDVQSVDIPIPSLLEQQKIATVLHTVDQAIQKTEKLVAQLNRLKQGIAQEIFTKGKFKYNSYQDSIIGELPQEWNINRLGKLVDLRNGLNFSSEQKGSGTLLINVTDVYDDIGLNPSDLSRVNISDDEVETYKLNEGDIITARSSKNASGVGQVSIYRGSKEPVVFAGFTIRQRPNQDLINPEYLVQYLRYPEARKRVVALGGQVALTNISQTDLSKVAIPVPPIQEQREIAGMLREYDNAMSLERKKISRLKRLKRGLMQDLLSGEVRTTDVDIDIPEEVAKYG